MKPTVTARPVPGSTNSFGSTGEPFACNCGNGLFPAGSATRTGFISVLDYGLKLELLCAATLSWRLINAIKSSWPCRKFVVSFSHANFVRHPAQRRAASRKLFRDDAARHRASGQGR